MDGLGHFDGVEDWGKLIITRKSKGHETGVLDPRPKPLRFHMPGPATHP
jgi:hypothetical protein